MLRKLKVILVAAVAGWGLIVPLGAVASHSCGGNVIVEAGGVYVDEREDGIWTYAESNDIEGLQRGGKHPALGYVDPCTDHDGAVTLPPDTLLF